MSHLYLGIPIHEWIVVFMAACFFWGCVHLYCALIGWKKVAREAIADAIQAREERGRIGQELLILKEKILARSLTPAAPRAQTPPKRLTGAQLRRTSDQVNVEAFASLQERPNSEVLQEQD